MVNKINRSNKVIRKQIASISGAKNTLGQIAKKKINGPLSIGLVLSPSIIIIFLAFTGLNDPSGLLGALLLFIFIIPAIISALLIVIGLARGKSSSIEGN